MAEIGVFLNRSLGDTNPSEAEAVAYDKFLEMRNAIVSAD